MYRKIFLILIVTVFNTAKSQFVKFKQKTPELFFASSSRGECRGSCFSYNFHIHSEGLSALPPFLFFNTALVTWACVL